MRWCGDWYNRCAAHASLRRKAQGTCNRCLAPLPWPTASPCTTATGSRSVCSAPTARRAARSPPCRSAGREAGPTTSSSRRLADERGIDFLLPIARWKGYGGDTDYQGATLGNADLGLGAARLDLLHHRVRHRACTAVQPGDRGEGDRHRRPHRRRPLRAQPRGRLERGRVRDVRRRAARARGALHLRAGMARRRQAHLVAGREFRHRRAITSSSRACAPSPSPMAARAR